nr:hypothetical protein [Rhizobacter sp. J219]
MADLDVQSELGKGSSFSLVFPAARVRVPEPTVSVDGKAVVKQTAPAGDEKVAR